MKKVLFATTALVAFAGAAAAETEIKLSGSAEMGVRDDGTSTQFLQSVDVRFALRGTTDNGLNFGATVDLEDAVDTARQNGQRNCNDLVDCSGFADYTVFLSGQFGNLTLGDTDGALDWAVTELDFGGAIADDHTAHYGFSGNGGVGTAGTVNIEDRGIGLDGLYDGQILRYDNTFGGFGVAVSIEVDNDTIANLDADPIYGIGAKYTLDGFANGSFAFGGGYQTTTGTLGADAIDASSYALSAVYSTDALNLGVNYGATDLSVGTGSADITHLGVGGSYTFDAITVAANWGEFDIESGVQSATLSGFGLSAVYDLGGGIAVQAGYGTSSGDPAFVGTGSPNLASDLDTWSLGVAMSF